ncbi:putative reverse transcriptase domain-containing protein [Tanacetum coccineum]
MAPKKRTTRTSPATTTTTTTPITDAQLKTLIARGVADALAERDADRSRNGDDSHDTVAGVRRQAPIARECTCLDFMKCQPLNFKGTKGFVELTQWFERMKIVFRISNCTVENQIKFATCTLLESALTWWNSHVRTVGHDELALTCDKMFPEESNKIKKYFGGLPDMIHGSVMASKPKTMQDATELMDKKISTLVERQAENKRKLDNNNQAQQQTPKKQGVAIAYTAGPGERKEYVRTLPLCNKCKFHHNGQCTVKRANYKRVGHLTRDCRSPAATNNQRNLTCYKCRNQGHYMSDCPELKNQNHRNQAGGQFSIKLARQKSYADVRRKPLEFQVSDLVILKVPPWKGVIHFGKRGKSNPRYIRPFKVLEKVGDVSYKLELPQELSRVHNTLHVSNLKKCYFDEPLAVPLDEIHIDDKLYFMEEPVEIKDREVKRFKQSRIPIVKVRWNSRRGPEFI